MLLIGEASRQRTERVIVDLLNVGEFETVFP